jgi:hypothetical protein
MLNFIDFEVQKYLNPNDTTLLTSSLTLEIIFISCYNFLIVRRDQFLSIRKKSHPIKNPNSILLKQALGGCTATEKTFSQRSEKFI